MNQQSLSQQSQKPTFSSGGQTWHLSVNVGKLKEIRDTTGVDLGGSESSEQLFGLLADPVKMCELLWILVEKQADGKNVTPEQFGEGLDGDALEAAWQALVAALVLFSPARLRGAMGKQFRLAGVAMDRTAASLETLIDEQAEQTIDLAHRKSLEEVRKQLGSQLPS